MKTLRNLHFLTLGAALFSLLVVSSLQAEPAGRTVVIKAFDTMKFSVTTIAASPGEKLTVELENAGTLPKEAMGHNWILLTKDADVAAYAKAAIAAKAENFTPHALASKVIASTRLLGPGERDSAHFTVPTVPGSYPFLCSFPAHFQAGMRGELVVK